jgi:hypothetical protein
MIMRSTSNSTFPVQVRNATTLALSSLMCAAFLACGRSDSKPVDSSATSASTPAAASSPGNSAATAAPFAFTDADLDALERGLVKETELFRASQERAASAKTAAERGAATQSGFEDNTIPEGAKAAGLDVERYRSVRETVNDVLTNMSFQGKIDGPLRLDTALATPEMKAKLAVDPMSTLAPQSAAALRARLDRIVKAWAEYKRLTAVSG